MKCGSRAYNAISLSICQGCRVIGFAGTDEKVRWLVDDLGFDKAYNYKTADWKASLKEAAPNGVDCYFDNVREFPFPGYLFNAKLSSACKKLLYSLFRKW